MQPYVIGADRLPGGRIFCAATDRSHNTVFVHESGKWRKLIGWNGHEVTACCACGDTIVCAALDDVAYVIEGTTITPVTLPEKTRTWVHGAAATSPDTALLGGAGGLFELSVSSRTAVRKRLSEFNVSRPGRDIHNVVRGAGTTWLLGAKNLLVDFRGDSAREPVPRDVLRGREVMFEDAADFDGRLWLSALEGPRATLAELDGQTLSFHDTPQPGQRRARIAAHGGELFVGASGLSVGRPGSWRDLSTPGLGPKGDAIVAIVAPQQAGELAAVSSDGRSFFTDGKSCMELAVF